MGEQLPLAVEAKSIRIGEVTYEGSNLGIAFVSQPAEPEAVRGGDGGRSRATTSAEFAMPARNLAIGGWFDIAVWNSVQGHPQLDLGGLMGQELGDFRPQGLSSD